MAVFDMLTITRLTNGQRDDGTWPTATLSFYTVIGCHWLAFLTDLHTNLAVIAVIRSQNDRVAPG